ncbi:Complex I intermediate-associated protein 30 [Verrucomicrobiia bacterium DG1235]|nr:Complex I intermediate-associated protein 30 [Verrucomicrobiae bacterium DG1235]
MSVRDAVGVERRDRSKVIGSALAVGLVSAASLFPIFMSARTIAEFNDAESFREWTVVNDTVMGGVSQSSFAQTEEGNLLFSGELSLENNGGFVSIRNRPSALSLQDAGGIELRVRGDGRTYYLDLRANNQRMAGSFRSPFETLDGEWQDIFIPFDSFVAQSFGRPLPAVRLDPAAINSIGFTLSDKKKGPFQLEVEYVRSVEDDSLVDSPQPVVLTSIVRQRQLIELAIERGVPLFNEGSPAACAAIYEVACTALLAMPDLPDSVAASLSGALAEIKSVSSPTRKAWILRYALDDAFAALARSTG